MILQPKQIKLKDGRVAVLRTPEVEDADALLAFITKACGETEFLARYPEEWAGMPPEREQAWIKSLRASKGDLAIACFIDGKLAGNCEIDFKSGIKMGHRASVAIAILQEYWGLGIGSAMFEEMIAAARERGTQILELEFVQGNRRAQALYEKFGFRIFAERPNSIRLKDGTLLSEYMMQKYL